MPKSKPTVRSLAAADPAYATALELRTKLRSKQSALDAEENKLRDRIAQAKTAPGETAGVAALLGDVVVDDDAPNGPLARLTVIGRDRADLRRALEIAEGRVQQARFAASRMIVGEVRDAYTDRVRALAAALVNANSAHNDLLALISDLNAADVAWSADLPPMQAHRILGERGSRVGAWLRAAKSAGFIDMVPEGFEQ